MYSKDFLDFLKSDIARLKEQGRYKDEPVLEGPQAAWVKVRGKKVLMLASNNYLGLANHPVVVRGAARAMGRYGFGMASVRFIAGTAALHMELEKKLAAFLRTEDALLFSSCFAANEALFAALASGTKGAEPPVVIYTDALNHASIIDGLKLVKNPNLVKRIYPHNDLATLGAMMAEDQKTPYRLRLAVTDGVFSMEGELAKLRELTALCQQYGVLLVVDDSHGLGACGATGRGSLEAEGVLGKVDVISGTLGKALGGANGGFLAGKKELIAFLRQKARPYLFSNSLSPALAGGALAALEYLKTRPRLVKKLDDNARYFREQIVKAGLRIIEGTHPIVPIMTQDASLTQRMSKELLKKGLYVTGLWFPVVPEGQARLRAQISAAHTKKDLDFAARILVETAKKLHIIS